MSGMFKLLGGIMICVCVAVVMKSAGKDVFDVIKIISGVIVAGMVLLSASPLLEFAFDLAQGSRVNTYLSVMIKSLGIAFLTHICASVCRDCGENTMAGYAELAGKIEMLIISVPLIEEVIGVAQNLVEMI
ncbi:MAG: hypothetical protein E7667_05060 [Ruminococcaceae bacterium]|nr:hypothetical protein [Oscillospiraceae bacterium]